MIRVALGICIGAILVTLQAKAHFRPGTEHNRRHAIIHAFCHSLKPCELGRQALNVAYCESGPNLWHFARNGQYLGMFQFGSFARTRFGFSWSPWKQSRAAYRYFIDSGRDWSPWSCQP
jgi:hypothetical protein